MENNRTLTIYTKEVRKEKQVFFASDAIINGKWYKIKFTKECNKSPKEKGIYELIVSIDSCSLEKGKKYVDKEGISKTENDIIWVREVVNLRKYTEDELKELNRATMIGVFGE